MAKRKAVMKNIIYELDNDDIEISSDDEVSSPKESRLEQQSTVKTQEIIAEREPNGEDILSVDSTDDSICFIDSPNRKLNGGKITSDTIVPIDSPELTKVHEINFQTETDCATQNNSDFNKSNLNEDIEVDSPPTLCTAGCENRIPLVTVHFKNSKLSSSCKAKIKEFIVNLLKQKQGDNIVEHDGDGDHELDIWPEDLITDITKHQNAQTEEVQSCDDSLFFVDTAPCEKFIQDIPQYSHVSSIMSDEPEVEGSQPRSLRRNPKCFNCDGVHWLRDCKYPKNQSRIAENRYQSSKVGRYHIEDDQKYGHLTPGRISGALRHAMGLKRNTIPLFIYRMRMLGYPPGWLEEARISHSGITMFDSTGTAIMDPEEEDGEICEAGSKDKFDIKKILDFPGFNVPVSSRYVEEAHLYGLPPMSDQDSKIAMLQMLAPNAMKAYKRKKLTLFPSSANNSFKEGQAEMELDSGDEQAVFPLVPPLPDEAPPPLPPPPEQPPPPAASPPRPSPSAEDSETSSKFQPIVVEETADDLDSSDVEITSVVRVSDIPMPEDSLIVIDECYDTEKPDTARTSPTLDDLEKKKQVLIEALEGDVSAIEPADVTASDDTPPVDIEASSTVPEANMEIDEDKVEKSNEDEEKAETEEVKTVLDNGIPSVSDTDCREVTASNAVDTTNAQTAGTSETKAGHVKTTSFGAPVLNIASSFVKLPTDDKFSKHICDVINFENLPNSTGKYRKIRNMLKRVKTKVDKIQDS